MANSLKNLHLSKIRKSTNSFLASIPVPSTESCRDVGTPVGCGRRLTATVHLKKMHHAVMSKYTRISHLVEFMPRRIKGRPYPALVLLVVLVFQIHCSGSVYYLITPQDRILPSVYGPYLQQNLLHHNSIPQYLKVTHLQDGCWDYCYF